MDVNREGGMELAYLLTEVEEVVGETPESTYTLIKHYNHKFKYVEGSEIKIQTSFTEKGFFINKKLRTSLDIKRKLMFIRVEILGERKMDTDIVLTDKIRLLERLHGEYNDDGYIYRLENGFLHSSVNVGMGMSISNSSRTPSAKPIPKDTPMLNPAIQFPDGKSAWYKNGLLHRENGPAIVSPYIGQEWYFNGLLHRRIGPAFIRYHTREIYYDHGLVHRDNGPAVIYYEGYRAWYHKGNLHSKEVSGNLRPAVITKTGTREWYHHGYLHRENGPAIIYPNGTEFWYQKGVLHRENGPAVIYLSGRLEYWKEGKRHRDDGPAFIYANGKTTYYKNGIKVGPLNHNY